MRHRILFLILLGTVACGCNDGAQHGRYTVSGDSAKSVNSVPGSLTIIRGDPEPVTPQSAGQQPLLYILTLAPSIRATGGGSSNDHGTYVSKHQQIWETAQGQVTVELSWDRRTDTVSAGGATFDRQRGNAFVLIRDTLGNVAVTQAGPLSAGLDHFVALQQIQAALPTDSLAKTVTLTR